MKPIQNATCDNCLEENVAVIKFDQYACKTDLCMKCLATAANLLYQAVDHNKNSDNLGELRVTSGVSFHTKEPFVTLESPHLDHPLQMDIPSGRDFIQKFSTVIEAAVSDAIIAGFFGPSLGDQKVAILLSEFRVYRDEHPEFG